MIFVAEVYIVVICKYVFNKENVYLLFMYTYFKKTISVFPYEDCPTDKHT